MVRVVFQKEVYRRVPSIPSLKWFINLFCSANGARTHLQSEWHTPGDVRVNELWSISDLLLVQRDTSSWTLNTYPESNNESKAKHLLGQSDKKSTNFRRSYFSLETKVKKPKLKLNPKKKGCSHYIEGLSWTVYLDSALSVTTTYWM